jgi:2-polyprenyl-3-methyl-5-hydroxy-6-metoxy-1,4-benzoquinol methylase/uncharacterized protein YbaR (Trm112 family)
MTSETLDPWLMDHLVCPRDHGHLTLKTPRFLHCPSGHSYPIVGGIVVMLLAEVTPTHGIFSASLEQARETTAPSSDDSSLPDGAIDPFVQKEIAATCGNMYKPLIHQLKNYPIPQVRLPPGNGSVLLDIGCNWGRWCVSAARAGYRAVGIDPSLEALRAARRVARQLGVSTLYVVADARHLPFAPGSFETVFSYSVLQHLERDDVHRTVREIARVLRAGGVSLVQMPNRFGLLNVFYELRQLVRGPVLFDVHYWWPWTLRSVFGRALGPTTLSVDGFFSLNPQKSDRAMLPWYFRLIVSVSEALRKLSAQCPGLAYLADSLYVRSERREQEETT